MFESEHSERNWPIWIRYFFLIGLFCIITRLILDSQFRQSSVLYILVPYLVAVAVYKLLPRPRGETRMARFWRGLLGTLIVMLGTSAILFEGFLCVLMFLPIYLLFAALTLIVLLLTPEEKDRSHRLKSSILPLVIAIASLEGVNQTLSGQREYTISQTIIAEVSVEQINNNLREPIHLNAKRSPFLSLFPLPTRVDAGTFKEGDIHKAFFSYHRWGIQGFNSKHGEVWLKLAELTPYKIRTEVLKDTSYFSHYLTIHGTEINLRPISDDRTEIELLIHYRRDLDPSWYFGPLQKMALEESAEYLAKHVIARNE